MNPGAFPIKSATMVKKKFQYRIEYLLFRTLETAALILPRGLALRLGAFLGSLIGVVQPRRQETALRNLRRAFPEKPESEIRALQRESFRHLGIGGVEILRLKRYATREAVERYIDLEGVEHLRNALAQGRGAIILTGHLGFWEAGNMVFPLLGHPLDCIYKPIKNPYIDRHILSIRSSGGGLMIEKNRAARRIVRSLNENRPVAVLIDQRLSRRESVEVDFFAQPVNATPVIAQIAIKLGTPVVPCFCYRLPDHRYRMRFEPVIDFAPESDPSRERLTAATQQLTACIEAAIRTAPDQWFWIHDRWRL